MESSYQQHANAIRGFLQFRLNHNNGFKGISTEEALIVNLVTEPYDYQSPDEWRIAPHSSEIPYDWSRKDG